MNFRIYPIVILLLCLVGTLRLQAQSDNIYRANKLFEIGNHKAALPLYLASMDEVTASPVLQYKLGVSFMQSPELNEQLKSIPHLEAAVKSDETPAEAYFYLGQAYHKNVKMSDALKAYEKYKNKIDKSDKKKLAEVERYISISDNAIALISRTSHVTVNTVGSNINSEYTEYNPVVSADESVMAFTALKPVETKGRKGELEEVILITYKKDGQWATPKPLDIKVPNGANIGTAGMSPDGQQMIIFVGGVNNTGNLYTIEKTGAESWGNPVSLGNTINTKHLESTASITPDGKTIYFASNRPGGYGGMDIYRTEKNSKGAWGLPENLGPGINTEFDDDAPFIHPDQRTLFFTSAGHQTMGGKDIFKTIYTGSGWSKPENMGYPINTPADDNYFTLTADGRKGFFSSDRAGGLGGQDIYYFNMPQDASNIALTMVKGKILAGEGEGKAVPTQIKVVDNDSNKKIDYVYSPNPETGNYLIIFPPGKNYDMIIESEGFMPYTININVPNQNYFYELYQHIHLKPIMQFDVVVGQEVEVKNAFFDHQHDIKIDPKMANEAMLVKSDSLDMFDLMEAVIASNDDVAFDYLLDLMYATNPVDMVDFDSDQIEEVEAAKRTYYYDESDESTLEAKVVGSETIYTLPTMFVTELAKKQKEENKNMTVAYDKSLLKPIYKLYFDVDQSALKAEYHAQLQEIMSTLKAYENLGIEISGYASSDGNAEHNRKLSNQRAIEVLNFFNHKGLVRRRIIAKGLGASDEKKEGKDEGRRVEIRIVDLNTI